MSDDDLPPELDDFSEVMDQIKPTGKGEHKEYTGDYTKTRDEIENEMQQKISQELQKKLVIQELEKEKKFEEQKKQEEEDKKREKQSGGGGLFGGMKGGFLSSGKSKKKTSQKKEEVKEIKFDKVKAEKNKLEIGEVQEAMNMNDYLNKNKEQWMTKDLLDNVSTNPNLQKLWSNPEYANALTMMQKDPKKAMELYGKNPEFMMLFQEFCKLMGNHFQTLPGDTQQPGQKQQQQQQQQTQPKVQEVKKLSAEDLQQIELQKKLEIPEVKAVMQDPQIQRFLQYVQTQKRVDFHQVMRSDPVFAKKLQVLVKYQIINLQGM